MDKKENQVNAVPVVVPHGKAHGYRLSYFKDKRNTPQSKVDLKEFVHQTNLQFPTVIDLSSKTTPVYDQGELGDCVSNAMAAACRYLLRKENEVGINPCRLFLYWCTRALVMQEQPLSDSGSSLHDAIVSLTTYGVCRDKLWPYITSQFEVQPPTTAFSDALHHKLITYAPVSQNLNSLLGTLASGFLVVIGIQVYSSFMTSTVAQTGIVPMPQPGEQIEGGHALAIVGADQSKQMFYVQNSWGTDWGLSGFLWLPFSYVLDSNLCFEIYTLTEFDDL